MRGEVRRIIRPAAVALAAVALTLIGGLWSRPAHAQPVLTIEASCSPDPVRPFEQVLITCNVSVTNSGDATASDLSVDFGDTGGCSFPFDAITIGYRLGGGELRALPIHTPSYSLGDLAAGATVESQLSLVARAFETGASGGAMVVFSLADTSIRASADACWTVSGDAPNPPTDLEVSKRLVSPADGGGPIIIDRAEPVPAGFPGGEFGEPPPRPPDGMPVPIEVRPPPQSAQFEITIANSGGAEMTGVSVYDVQTGTGTVLVESQPPETSRDAAYRPTWDLGPLAVAASTSIQATYGPQQRGICAFAYDLVIVTATRAGGPAETYVAQADRGTQMGDCESGATGLCWHYPPDDGRPTIAPCAEEVCWTTPLEGEGFIRLVGD